MMRLAAFLFAACGIERGAAYSSPAPADHTASPSYSHGLPGSLGMNWTEDDKRRDPEGWRRHVEGQS